MADLSILDAFNKARSSSMQEGNNSLQQVGALQGILAKQQAAQKEQAFSRDMASAKTPEEQYAVAVKYGGPAAVMQSMDRRTTADQTKQLAMSRLSAQMQRDAADIAHKARTATTAEEKFHWQQQMDTLKATAQRQAAEIAAGRYTYDTGNAITPFQGTVPQAAPAGATGGGEATFNFRLPNGQAISGTAPNEAGAIGIGQNALGMRPGVLSQVAAQVPQSVPTAPAEAPVAAPAAFPAAPNNLDARDLGAGARGPVLPTATPQAPVAAPVAVPVKPAPVMPQFTGSPREQAAAKNKWLLAQAKGGEAGGKATETVVDAILEGRMQMPTGFALRSPYWQDVIERVNVKDPKFDASRYGARAAARRTFASGPEARNVTALNTVIGHLGTLDEAAQALNNQDVRAFNAVANRLATELGDPRVQNFDTAKQAVAEETMRVFRQVGASEIEARMWGERIQASGSPNQLRGVIGTLGKLLESRVEAIGQQYERTVNSKDNPARVDPANKTRLDQLIKQGDTPVWDNTKEQRYQELLRKQRGGS